MNPADEMAAAAGSGEKSDQQLRAILENLQRVNPVEQDDLRSGIAHRETSERRAIYDRLVAIEKEMKRRGRRRGFARYLVAFSVGVAATLAWQSYSEAIKQIIAIRAPELGWSPEAKQVIASSIEWLGWTKSPSLENTAPQAVAPKAPTAPSLDPAQVQEQNLVALREMVQQLTAGQDQTTRDIAKLEFAVVEILKKIPEPPPQPPAAPAHKSTVLPPSSRAPTAPPSSRPLIPPQQ